MRRPSSVSVRVDRVVLQHMDKMRHVSACGEVPFGLGTIVAVPGVVVHRVEGHAPGLYGSRSGGT